MTYPANEGYDLTINGLRGGQSGLVVRRYRVDDSHDLTLVDQSTQLVHRFICRRRLGDPASSSSSSQLRTVPGAEMPIQAAMLCTVLMGTASPSGSQAAAGVDDRLSVRRSRMNATAPRTAGTPS